MNVTVENLAPCKKLLRFEVEAEKVDQEFEAATKDVVRHAALPGFRPGKAPRDIVAKKYEKEIQDQVKQKLMADSYQAAVKEQKLQVIGYPDIEEIQFSRGQAMQFAATIETAPEFEMPPYRGLPAKREGAAVTDADMERAIDALRKQQATFNKVERSSQEGDFVVVNYTGTCEGKPITEFAATAKGLTEQKNFWMEVKKDSFIPGFTEQLVGAKAGDKRTVTVDFPADFVTQQLAGKKGAFEVEVVEVKERVLPEMNDEFAKSYGAENVERLREGVRADLQNELNSKVKRSVRAQVIQSLFEKVNFELPESLVQHETRNAVYDIVSNIQRQGAGKEAIDQQKEEIYSTASRNAKDRVKINLLLQRVAEKEGIRVNDEELNARLILLARQYKMAPEKFIKELEKRNAVDEIYLQLLNEKVVDFLVDNAKIEDATAPTPA